MESATEETTVAQVPTDVALEGQLMTPAKPVRPSLRGKLVRMPNQLVVWEGTWAMKDTEFDGGLTNPFRYERSYANESSSGAIMQEQFSDEHDRDLLSSGSFTGHFFIRVGNKNRKIAEKDVIMDFTVDETLPKGTLKVVGTGSNAYGKYTLEGTLELNTQQLNVYREYEPVSLEKPVLNRKNSQRVATTRPAAPPPLAPEEYETPNPLARTPSGGEDLTRVGRVRRVPSHLILDSMDEDVATNLTRMKAIVRDLQKADRERWFLVPVDPVALNLLNYNKIIKNPMDLGTVVKKLDAKEYMDYTEVAADVRLTFNNAIKYNGDGNLVTDSARRLLNIFESKVVQLDKAQSNKKKRPSLLSRTSSSKKLKSADVFGPSDDEDGYNSDDDLTSTGSRAKKGSTRRSYSSGSGRKSSVVPASEFNKLQKQLEMINAEMLRMRSVQEQTFYMAQTQQISGPPVQNKTGQLKRNPSMRELTYQEKRQLTEDIRKLDNTQIAGVVKIFEESSGHLGGENDEVEIDLDNHDAVTLRKLQKYVKKCLQQTRSSQMHEYGYDDDEDYH